MSADALAPYDTRELAAMILILQDIDPVFKFSWFQYKYFLMIAISLWIFMSICHDHYDIFQAKLHANHSCILSLMLVAKNVQMNWISIGSNRTNADPIQLHHQAITETSAD